MKDETQMKFRKNAKRLYRAMNHFRNTNDSDEINRSLKQAGIPINLNHYQIIRYSFLAFYLLMIVIASLKGGGFSIGKLSFLLLLGFLTMPKQTILGKSTPFQLLINLFLSQKREKYNQELYMAISQLKNTFLIKKDSPPSSDLILDQVRKYTNYTRNIFNQMLSYWMIGEKELAVQFFEKEIGTKEAQDLGQVFLKLDDLNPHEMSQQLEAYQEIYRTEKETKKLKSNEHKSNVLFIFIVASSLAVMINFLVVVFFIDFLKDMESIL